MRRTIVICGIAGMAAGLVVAPHTPFGRNAGLTVLENRAVVIAPGVEVRLGTPVSRLPDVFSLEAYDRATGNGIVQWRRPDAAPVLLIVRDGFVEAISVAFEPGFRTSKGVALGDHERTLERVYGGRLRDGHRVARRAGLVRGFALTGSALASEQARSYTYFDTSCTRRVNAIGLALGFEGLRALGSLWAPADPADACNPVR